MKVVEFKAVSKSYNGTRVLKDIDFQVEKGERLILLGPSGCGKTTILRLIAGFIAPDQGSIEIGGRVVSEPGRIVVPPEERNLGMVFQDLALWPHLSVKGNLEFGLKAKGFSKAERDQRIEKMLEMVGLREYANRKPGELSGGQQQRVALARALVLEPTVMLMDEPLSSLDTELNIRLRREVIALHKSLGFTMIYVTHDREEAFEIATRVMVMSEGEIVKVGSVKEVRNSLTSISPLIPS